MAAEILALFVSVSCTPARVCAAEQQFNGMGCPSLHHLPATISSSFPNQRGSSLPNSAQQKAHLEVATIDTVSAPLSFLREDFRVCFVWNVWFKFWLICSPMCAALTGSLLHNFLGEKSSWTKPPSQPTNQQSLRVISQHFRVEFLPWWKCRRLGSIPFMSVVSLLTWDANLGVLCKHFLLKPVSEVCHVGDLMTFGW